MHEEAFFARAEQDTATMTEYVPDPDYNTADFCPRYEFTTKAGQPVSYVGDNCVSQPDSSKIGQTEQVYIDPKVPQVIESRGWTGSEGSGLILGIAGFLFFPLLGLSIYLITLFSERKKATYIKRKPASASSTDMELAQLELIMVFPRSLDGVLTLWRMRAIWARYRRVLPHLLDSRSKCLTLERPCGAYSR